MKQLGKANQRMPASHHLPPREKIAKPKHSNRQIKRKRVFGDIPIAAPGLAWAFCPLDLILRVCRRYDDHAKVGLTTRRGGKGRRRFWSVMRSGGRLTLPAVDRETWQARLTTNSVPFLSLSELPRSRICVDEFTVTCMLLDLLATADACTEEGRYVALSIEVDEENQHSTQNQYSLSFTHTQSHAYAVDITENRKPSNRKKLRTLGRIMSN
ncbi:hypothetical protein G7K_4138-t1 [Saitoella complicata NRRL Y-17804]|uniref:Uncharacterized protein n=1 Tax=Saitoella complicata (strain BCRC 22490 / CBS 7301 / JCM 7358 / NBRC 10748 / NRRL Y-17804) TaxID=698492 RepID=A0A0E9NJM0_SAICN|nr:hypothetical protein G7K_4138-t1 [Saitoella complicata NRRL Y-17804]